MKKVFLLIFIGLLLSVSAAYAGDLEDVMNAGTLQFGVATDRTPFVFYDENDDLTGIDIKLMEEIARRMGLKLEVTEMASDDLIESLNIGQVDIVGGAFSKTDSRKEVIDFTNNYYIADAVVVISNGSASSASAETTSFAGKKAGALKGSGFEDFLKTDLIEKGEIEKKNIYTYDKMSDAMKALDRNKIDMVLMDSALFQYRYQSGSDYHSYNYADARDSYAFGIRKDSDLKSAINKQLTAMMKDGSAQEIADTFFNMVPEEEPSVIQWNSPKPQQATATPAVSQLPTAPASLFPVVPTAVPTAAPAAQSCNYTMSYVADLTIPDGQPISAGSSFTKTWRLKNTGNCAWTTSFVLSFVSGAQMGGTNRYLPYQVNPGETIDLSVDLVAPTTPGTYQGYWQIKTPSGFGVGFTVWVQIVVPGAYSDPTETPNVPFMPKFPLELAPTATPMPNSAVKTMAASDAIKTLVAESQGDYFVPTKTITVSEAMETAVAKSKYDYFDLIDPETIDWSVTVFGK